jgi:hypothetical protein
MFLFVCFVACLDDFPPLETKRQSHFLMTTAVIGFIQCSMLTFWGGKRKKERSTCEPCSIAACSATARVHFKENIYCVFLEGKMKICSDEVQCFLDKKFPDTKFSHVRGWIF